MGDYGIKISKDGIDVETALDDDLIFTTKYSYLKIVKIGTFSYTFSSNPGAGCMTLGTIAHNIDVTPAHDSFFNHDIYGTGITYTKSPYFTASIGPGPDDLSAYEFTSYCNNTNIVFRMCRYDYGGAGSPINLNGKTVNYKYYIFADPGS